MFPKRAKANFFILASLLVCAFKFHPCEGCSQPLGLISGEVKDWQISASSTYPSAWDPQCHEKFARLYQQNGFGWCAKYKSSSEWLQIDLGVAAKITGLMTQGRGDGNEWVTVYMVSYSMDAYHWQYLSDKYGNQKLFDGNIDSYSVKHVYLEMPIFARYIKFHTVQWHKHPSMRVELIGCQECKQLLGLPPFGQYSSSSTWPWRRGSSCQPEDGSILSGKAWCAHKRSVKTIKQQRKRDVIPGIPEPPPGLTGEGEWFEVDVGHPTLVTGVVTKGRGDSKRHQWVTLYWVSYSNDSVNWFFYKDGNHLDPKTFSGNRDRDTENQHYLNAPFVARFVRFHPIEFNNHISMRVGVYGCPYRGPCGPGFVRVQEDTPCVANMAFKRETHVNDKRRAWKRRGKVGHSALAVDGDAARDLGSCAIVDNAFVDTPAWGVDLGDKRDVKGVVILTWQGKGQDSKLSYRDFMYNLEKIVVYVSRRPPAARVDNESHSKTKDSSSSSSSSSSDHLPDDAEMCGHVTRLNYALFAPRVHVQCGQPLWGRYVIVEAHGVKNRWKRNFSLVLCEVMVY